MEFTIEDYEQFEQDYKQYIANLPSLMVEMDIFPTVDNIKTCLIEYIDTYEALPDNIKEEMNNYISHDATFCNMVSDDETVRASDIKADLLQIK
jgi:hypothetical protein